MGEILTKAEIFQAVYVCDECKKGEMEFGGRVLTVHPLRYPHKCNICGHSQVLDHAYPRTVVK